ncbi:MAG: HNH endonuclease [Candidatus Obscuribacterales bacterium]|nr:HNH endonuclease [Candidatus Obscuribacterales bacterium]
MLPIPDSLPPRHKRALAWFSENTGKVFGWPIAMADQTILANRAKGIYKPAWSNYALSVKQTLSSTYGDHDPIHQENGIWTYLYYQEEQEGKDPEQLSSNRAMKQCLIDEIPIGVLRQLSPKPNVRYSVLGLARIIGKSAGYYLLEGTTKTANDKYPKQATESDFEYSKSFDSLIQVCEAPDLRMRRLSNIVQRQGQMKFREQLLTIYERQCAITACNVPDVLEAAHVLPYRGPGSNHISNGIVLRADVHLLFDAGLVAIDPFSRSVILSPKIKSNLYYKQYNGIPVHPGSKNIDPELLKAHKHYCGL